MVRKNRIVDRQEATNRYLRLANTGTVAAVIVAAAALSGVEGPKETIGSGAKAVVAGIVLTAAMIMIVILPFLFKKKLRDEYLQGLWNAGTSAGFITGVAFEIIGGLIVGATRGANGGSDTDFTHWLRGLHDESLTVAILAFFIAFQIKRWRDR